MNAPAREPETLESWKYLLFIVLLAFGLRLYFMRTQAAVIENEGAGYAQQAELLRGKELGTSPEGGWLRWKRPGSAEEGLDVVETWFYPFLIAATTLLTHNSENATRLVSVVAGTCLIFPLYFLAARMYGRRTAEIAAALVCFHPLLISLSVAGYTEGLHLPLMMGGIYWAMRMLEPASDRSWLFAGILFGCAYLNRPESLVFPFIAVIVILAANFLNKRVWRKTITTVSAFLLVFFLVASPYVIFLWKQTGSIRFEGKNLVNYTIGRRILSGMSYAQASRGIDENLNAVGPLLDQNRFATYSPYPTDARSVVRYFFRMAGIRKFWLYYNVLTSFALGSLLLWFFAGWGLLGRVWDRRRFFQELLLLGVFGYLLIVLLAAHTNFLRYSFPLLPFLLLWSSSGIITLYRWALNSAAAILENGTRTSIGLAYLAAAIPLVAMLGFSAVGIREIGELESARPRHLPVKEAGLWLRAHQPGPKSIFSSTVMAYYADAYQLLFPYADSELALRYIHKIDPDFIAIEPYSEASAPYLAEWVRQGIPDPQAKLIYETSTPQSGKIQIYNWKHEPNR
jgi:4-amino-4-deoxy-L-arabinose transferase-like glycosyltransferase